MKIFIFILTIILLPFNVLALNNAQIDYVEQIKKDGEIRFRVTVDKRIEPIVTKIINEGEEIVVEDYTQTVFYAITKSNTVPSDWNKEKVIDVLAVQKRFTKINENGQYFLWIKTEDEKTISKEFKIRSYDVKTSTNPLDPDDTRGDNKGGPKWSHNTQREASEKLILQKCNSKLSVRNTQVFDTVLKALLIILPIGIIVLIVFDMVSLFSDERNEDIKRSFVVRSLKRLGLALLIIFSIFAIRFVLKIFGIVDFGCVIKEIELLEKKA